MNPWHEGGHVILKEFLMGIEKSRLEIARKEVEMEWLTILSRQLIPPRGLKCLSMRLMIVEILEDDDNLKLIWAPFSRDPRDRHYQVQDVWTDSSAGRRLPVGIIFIGVNDVGPVNGVQLVAPRAVAEIVNYDEKEMTDWLRKDAEAIAALIPPGIEAYPDFTG
jgi:hypothetical protein